MLRRIITRVQDAIIRNPERILAGSAALLLVALALGWGVEFRTSRSDLAPPDDPDQRRLEELVREFGGSSDLIACVESAPRGAGGPGAAATPAPHRGPAELRAFADALAEEFRSDRAVAQVFHKVDLDWFVEKAFYLAPRPAIEAALAAARHEPSALAALRKTRSLANLNELIARRLEAGLATPGTPPLEGGAEEGLRALAALLHAERRFLEDPAAALAALESAPPLLALAGDRPGFSSQGYLATRDGLTLFLLVSPASQDDSLSALRAFVGAVRRRVETVAAAHPGFRVSFTGEPATTVEEMDIVRRDMWVTSIVSVLGVTSLTLLVFRWRSHALLVLLALAAGVAWSFGAVRLELGYLNLITSSFLSTLVGVGVAYGIHPVSEYELEGAHTIDPDSAVRAAYHKTGAGVTVGATTTAAAFFAILLMKFRGFAELGLVAGVGVLLCLLAALLTLPALLLVHGRRRQARDRSARNGSATAAVDRLWVERGAGRVCSFPRTTTALALALTGVLGWAAFGVGFNLNMLDLLPKDAESVRLQRRMVMGSDLSPFFNMVLADDLPALRAVHLRAAGEPAIERTESALQFLPEDPEDTRATLRELGALLDGIHLPEAAAPAGAPAAPGAPAREAQPSATAGERGRITASLVRLEGALGRASEAAFGAGIGRLAGPLEEARAAAEEARLLVERAPAGAERAWADGELRLLAWAHRALDDLRRAARAAPPTLDNLPAEIRGRFLTKAGRFIAFLHPAGGVFDPAFLEEYVAASRRVSPQVAGFPVVFLQMSRRITSGFHLAVLAGAALVILILLADYRNARETGLALIPLVMGIIWMLGIMRLLGLQYNFANLVAVPLIIGVGIDNGVHVVHRVRLEGERGMTIVLRHTGRAILIAGLTTMIGFGSLALASHRGLSSLGLVLLFGVGACLVASLVVLPNLLVAFGMARR